MALSATPAAPFEVLEQHSSGGSESGKADTSAAALGHSHQGCGQRDGFVLVASPCHPRVSQQGLAVGGFVQTHRWLCPGLIRSSAGTEMHLLSVGMAEKGREVFSCVLLTLGDELSHWHLGIQTQLLTPSLANPCRQNWVPINALNKNLLLPLQYLPTLIVSCSFWFVLPTFSRHNISYALTDLKMCSRFPLSKFAAAFSLAFGKQGLTLHFTIPLCWLAHLSAFCFPLLCLPFASGRAVRLCFENLSCLFLSTSNSQLYPAPHLLLVTPTIFEQATSYFPTDT